MESLNHRPGLTFQNREENGFREPPGILVCAIGSRTRLIPPDENNSGRSSHQEKCCNDDFG